ncbi:MAG: DJ-1/PfpI family protein [Lachnospiraceae bacterium]|nr:DJ-1/PfpI family protein [Lachnospiraceae bacterium]
MSKVAVFFAAGFEEVEAITTVNILRRAEIEALMVSVSGELLVKGARGIAIQTEALIADLDFGTIDMIVLPGGYPGYENLEACEELMEQVLLFHKQKKPIAAICGAPGILGRRGILSGSIACVYPGHEAELAGATLVTEPAVWDGNLITGRAMGCSVDFALAIVAYFKGFDAADKIAATIVYSK